MKKLLYLVPLTLLILCATPWALYKDKVDFLFSTDPKAAFEDIFSAMSKLSPSHWKMIDMETHADATLTPESTTVDSSETEMTGNNDDHTSEMPKAEALHEKATFRGFPFGAYLSKNSSSSSQAGSYTLKASAFSWLWVTADALLIVATLFIAVRMNRRPKTPISDMQPLVAVPSQSAQPASPRTIQPSGYDAPTAPAPPAGQTDTNHPNP
jgi:hypothetical protein